MIFCPTCGTRTVETAKFCGNCGESLAVETNTQAVNNSQQLNYSDSSTKSVTSGYEPVPEVDYQGNRRYQSGVPANRKDQLERTLPLKIVIILGWISVAILGIGTLIVLFILPPVAILFGAILILEIWIVRGLGDYNNNARIVQLVLAALGLISAILSFELISVATSGFIIYTLAFHEETVQLFKSWS